MYNPTTLSALLSINPALCPIRPLLRERNIPSILDRRMVNHHSNRVVVLIGQIVRTKLIGVGRNAGKFVGGGLPLARCCLGFFFWQCPPLELFTVAGTAIERCIGNSGLLHRACDAGRARPPKCGARTRTRAARGAHAEARPGRGQADPRGH